jgi:hypothetical protein
VLRQPVTASPQSRSFGSGDESTHRCPRVTDSRISASVPSGSCFVLDDPVGSLRLNDRSGIAAGRIDQAEGGPFRRRWSQSLALRTPRLVLYEIPDGSSSHVGLTGASHFGQIVLAGTADAPAWPRLLSGRCRASRCRPADALTSLTANVPPVAYQSDPTWRTLQPVVATGAKPLAERLVVDGNGAEGPRRGDQSRQRAGNGAAPCSAEGWGGAAVGGAVTAARQENYRGFPRSCSNSMGLTH